MISTCTSLRFGRGQTHRLACRVRDCARSSVPVTVLYPSGHGRLARNHDLPQRSGRCAGRTKGVPVLSARFPTFWAPLSARVHFQSVRSGRITCPDLYQGPRTPCADTDDTIWSPSRWCRPDGRWNAQKRARSLRHNYILIYAHYDHVTDLTSLFFNYHRHLLVDWMFR